MSKKRGPRIAPVIRAAFMNAIHNLEDKGVSLSDVIEECLTEKPIDTLRMLGPYVERDINVDIDGDINITWTLQSLTHQDLNSSNSMSKPQVIDSSLRSVIEDGGKPLQPLTISSEPS